MIMQRISKKAKERIANNILAFMVDDVSLLPETISFICNWVMQLEGTGRSKSYYDVCDIVLQNYLPKERPILFRSCKRLSNRAVQSFTGSIYAARKFSEGHNDHLLICDTKEYLHFEDENADKHERSFFPLCEFIRKGTYCATPYFSKPFYEKYKKEDEYIVRVNQNWLYDLKWNK